MMRYLLSLCSIAVALSAGAGGIAMKTGEWQFILDTRMGIWKTSSTGMNGFSRRPPGSWSWTSR